MRVPSVTGRNPHVPLRPLAETMALACCKINVSLPTRHLKILVVFAEIELPLKQPTCYHISLLGTPHRHNIPELQKQSMLEWVPSLHSHIASVDMETPKWTEWRGSKYTAALLRLTSFKTYVLEEEVALCSAICHRLSDCSQYLKHF